MSLYCHDRFKTWISATTGGDVLGEVVVAELYDAAQSELAALREELAVANHEVESRTCNEVAAIEALQETQQRLADAERRNAELAELLQRWDAMWNSGGIHNGPLTVLREATKSAIKPTESGASE